MNKRYIIALDEGTTSVRTILYDTKLNQIIAKSQKPFTQHYPKNGWVEQDAEEIWRCQKETLDEILSTINREEVYGIGITNQRETVVAWDKLTGKPICNAIVWQCRRTSKMIDKLPLTIKKKIKSRTGLIPNAYFSASKIKWIFDNVPLAKKLLNKDQLCIGTVDSYLAFKLTGKHVTDPSNASRTMLYNINTLEWDQELLDYFKIPEKCLPIVVDSNSEIGICNEYGFPLCGIIGDQQSSLVGQACFKKGMAKATFGTGCFILLNTGSDLIKTNNLLTTIAYTINGKTTYALEGSIYSACNAIDWLKDNLGVFHDYSEIDTMCNSLSSNEGVYFVPAFTGLGAPYWDDSTKGTIVGMTLATDKRHIVRACIESICYNTCAVAKSMSKKGINIKELHVDGGGSKNKFLLQFQANTLQRAILKSAISESTAMGAICMVGLNKKIFTLPSIEQNYKILNTYMPEISLSERNKLYHKWENAIKTTKMEGKIRNEK